MYYSAAPFKSICILNTVFPFTRVKLKSKTRFMKKLTFFLGNTLLSIKNKDISLICMTTFKRRGVNK